MIRTGIADIRPLYERVTYAHYYENLPQFRKEKADRIRDEKRKAQSVGVWVLYESLREKWNLSEEAPYNLSHSGDYVLCSIEDEEEKRSGIGCDIQENRPVPYSLIRRYFSSWEQAFILEKQQKEEREDAFCRCWTLKESFMKATRYGMKLGLHTFEIQMREDGPELVRMPEQIKETYYLKEYFLDIPYHIAVCGMNREFAEEIQKVEL